MRSIFLALLLPSLALGLTGIALVGRASLEHTKASPCTAADFSAKDLDVVLYGATGYTGGLSAKYLASVQLGEPRWAIAGRSAGKLEQLRRDLARSSSRQPAVIVADLSNSTALLEMTRRARAVLTFAGPFEAYGGEALISAALEGCAHYADLTGELAWKQQMLSKYGAQAAERGVAIVQSVGADSLPPDVAAVGAADALAADGKGPPDSVKVMVMRMHMFFSGGTMASAASSSELHPAVKDPYVLVPEASASMQVDTTLSGSMGDAFQLASEPYVLSDGDCTVVRRSMSLRFPNAPISVAEAMVKDAFHETWASLTDPRMLLQPVPVMPGPGEGPPEWFLRKGSYTLTALASREADGKEVKLSFTGQGEMGYGGTGMFATELVLGLALDGPVCGGYLTPATALAPGVLQRRLEHVEGQPFAFHS